MRSSLAAFALGLLLAAAGCTPQDLTGPNDPPPGNGTGNDDNDNDGGDPVSPPPPPRYTFSISGSATDPHLNEGLPVSGPYDLYLWLVCSNVGLTQLQADFTVTGDALVPDHFFGPEGSVVSIVWQEFGQLNLAVPDCLRHETLLGRLHVQGTGGGVRINMQQPASADLGAIGCAEPLEVTGFTCTGYASSGGNPPQSGGSSDACTPSPYSSSYTFAISASDTDPHAQAGEPTVGPVPLFLWSLSGSFSALQGDVHVIAAGGETDPVFAAVPPYLSLNSADGPDVLLASPGCSSGARLLGSLWIVDDGTGVYVTMTPGVGGGVADCDPVAPQAHLFRCLPFSSRT